MCHIFKKQQGFTLIELIISMAITAIIGAAAVTVFSVGMSLYAQANNTQEAQALALQTMQHIRSEVSYAKSVNIRQPIVAGSVSVTRSINTTTTPQYDSALYVEPSLHSGRLVYASFPLSNSIQSTSTYQNEQAYNANWNNNMYISNLQFAYVGDMLLKVSLEVKRSSTGAVLSSMQTNIILNNLDSSLGVTGLTVNGSRPSTVTSGPAIEFQENS
ncbi:type II secretion system protein J [Ethanoligenens sp.]|uniref:PulJ/GspJ family protein n=1 Tax=Ethanoligenens sp. TaxID=2099655 RepID=UPI0039EA2377